MKTLITSISSESDYGISKALLTISEEIQKGNYHANMKICKLGGPKEEEASFIFSVFNNQPTRR